METQIKMDSGEQGREVNIIRPTYNECRAINIIMPPLGHCDLGEGSLHRVLNSPTHSNNSDGSWDPVRELYAIAGGGEVPTEAELKAQEEEAIHLQAAEIATAEAERLRQEEENHRNLAERGRRIREEILQTKMVNQNVFTMPQ